MAIITISRGSASGGAALAEGLAEKLGYKIFTLEDVVHDAAKLGAEEEKLHEALLKPPGFLERMGRRRRHYLAFIQLALCEELKDGEAIYQGNAGHLLLPRECNTLKVRLVAPLDLRIKMLQERKPGMDRESALDYIRKVDQQRRDWTRFLYGVDILDPQLYDLVINLQTMTVDSAVEIVADLARRPEFKLGESGRRAIHDHVLASRVEAALAANPKTAVLEVDVRAKDGRVTLSGRLASEAEIEEVLKVVRAVEGVKEIDRDDLDHSEPLI